MGDKKIIHAEASGRVLVDIDGIQRGLNDLILNAEDSYDLEDILDRAITSLYASLPGGKENYVGENPQTGEVSVHRSLEAEKSGTMTISYVPSKKFEEEWEKKCGKKWIYASRGLGEIKLRERTCNLYWDNSYDECYWSIPEVLMRDTEKVMGYLGLKISKKLDRNF